ncbi:tyrosine-protein phosphatase non-receptor type substrate 1-like isoform X3 [Tachysurus fulvidraco]|uniref:tyrosine-protein phosphatase non-receptor type substrate 1-like isoform X2 n=1 Tax=Tachysurus fulvidraco TaxID=1234273 RepID=UPI001FED8D82|nr:tyrosine-protein phosphatase non-receptor type substrate 1-like isoform X2 [Tachysurus fulvidraco]XP_047658124.1 tyrosine-protein phosphatase non-receptor type substrate 1-like isoform X3 [Tachysurus fulvidraco]
MSGFSGFFLIFCTIHTVKLRRNYSGPDPKAVYQPDKVLCVNMGDSATLHCCVSGEDVGGVIWFKQPNRKHPQIMSRLYKTAEVTFFNEFQNLRFQVQISSNCSSMTISNIIQSDEAMYYCAITKPFSTFGRGTYLKIKGDHVTVASETSKAALCDHSVVCEPTLHGNNTNTNTQHNTVIGFGSALGLCALLIFCLTYYILRRRKCDKSKC